MLSFLTRWLQKDGDEVGVDFSGGQWQKIALARMFIRNSDLLVLDEPTAALDAQADYALHRRFVEIIEGCTSILITHRFNTVRMAHLIAILEDGNITEYGTHKELLQQGGTYAQLYLPQAEQYQPGYNGENSPVTEAAKTTIPLSALD